MASDNPFSSDPRPSLLESALAGADRSSIEESPLEVQAEMALKRRDIPAYIELQARRMGKTGIENISQYGRDVQRKPIESALDLVNPGGAMAGVIRKNGSQWLDKNMPAHMNILLGDQQYPNAAHNQALSKWIKGPMTKYLKNEMATPEDPIRKLAESGITHNPVIYPRLPHIQKQVQETRQAAGFPEPMGQSEHAKKWEDLADSMITSQPAKYYEGLPAYSDPWLTKLPPDEIVHDLPHVSSDLAMMNKLGMTQMRGFLRREMEQGNLRPENLNALTMEQAVRRMHDARVAAAKAKELGDTEKFAQYRNFPLHKEYESGWRWVDLPDTGTPEGLKTVKEIGCSGGWCTMKDTEAEGYGSKEGGNTLRALLDPTGRPHIQAHSEEMWDGPKNLNKTKLTQIKPLNNEWTSARVNEWTDKNPKYREEIIPMMQDYIRSGNFHEVRDYNNADLFPSSDKISPEGKALLEKHGHKVPAFINEQERGDLRDKLMKLLDLGEEMKEGGRVPNMADGGLVVLEERPSLLEAGLAGDRTGGIQNSPSVIQQAMDELNAKIGQSEYVQGVKQRMADPLGTIAGEAKRWSELPAEGMLGELGGHGLVGATKRVAESAYDPLFGYPSKAAFERYRKSEPREARLERLAEASKQRHPEALPASEALGKFEGKRLRLTQADRMIAAGEHQGGPRHSYLQQQSPEYKKRRSAWAVGNEQTANRMTKLNQSEPTVWTPYIGSEHQHASNLSAFNQLHKAFETAREEGKLPKELLNAYNQRLNVMSLKGQPLSVVKDSDKLMFPEGIDISKPGYRDLLNTYDKRREFANVIRGEGVGGKKAQIFDVDKMLHDLTEPSLRQVPQEHAGDTLFTLTGNVVHKPVMTKGAHPAYPYLLEGDDSGMIYRTTPAEVMVPEWTHGLEQKHGRGIQGIDYRTTDPNQFISEDYLNWLQRLGYKKGGQVKEPSIKEMKLSLMKSKTTGR